MCGNTAFVRYMRYQVCLCWYALAAFVRVVKIIFSLNLVYRALYQHRSHFNLHATDAADATATARCQNIIYLMLSLKLAIVVYIISHKIPSFVQIQGMLFFSPFQFAFNIIFFPIHHHLCKISSLCPYKYTRYPLVQCRIV